MYRINQSIVVWVLLTLCGVATGQPTVTVTAIDNEATEGGDTALVRFTRNGGDQSGSLVVQYLLEGTARTSGSTADYETDPAGVNLGFGRRGITIPADSAAVDMIIIALPDSLFEGDETVIVRIDPDSAYEVGDPDQATVTLIDDAAVVTVTALDDVAAEAGPDTGLVRFERAGGDLNADLLVEYQLQGQATASGSSADYETDPVGSGQGFGRLGIVIAAGETSRDMTITPFIDNDAEGPETVIVLLDPDDGYEVGAPDSATVTIQDNAATLSITTLDNSASERGDTATVVLERTGGDLGSSVTARLVFEGTADGSDYDVTPELSNLGFGILGAIFPADVTLVELEITPVLDSNEAEGDETVLVRLNNSSEYLVDGTSEVTVTIENFLDGVFQNGFEALALKSCAIDRAVAKDPARYQDNGSTVFDLETGLVWARCAPQQRFDWLANHCRNPSSAQAGAISAEGLLRQHNAGLRGDHNSADSWRWANGSEKRHIGIADGACLVSAAR